MASDIVSTTPQTLQERKGITETPVVAATGSAPEAEAIPVNQGSLARRMMLIAAGWIAVLLIGGGIALDRTLTNLVERNFDEQLEYILTAMIGSAEIEAGGEVYFNRILGDQRFLEPNSGLYWQISGDGYEPYPSRSLWDRTLQLQGDHFDDDPHFYDSDQFSGEPLRMVERSVILPNSDVRWTFAVASETDELEDQIVEIRSILISSFAALGAGLFLMTLFQIRYGLSPLRRVRAAIQKLRTTGENRISEPLPTEVEPLVEELNELLAHSEKQAEEARTHAGNLAHALKTPLTVLTNAATARDPKLDTLVFRETRSMQRHVDHHLARARAVGRRSAGRSRAEVWPSVESVLRAVTRIHEGVRFDLAGNRDAQVAIERQDLDEILGNLVENAAKYGGGSVFVTVDAEPDSDQCLIWVEDDGTGIPEAERERIFDRGVRLDTGKPGTGLGLAIVRDVAEIYGGDVAITESEDLGGLLVCLALPRVAGVEPV
ncbi:Histidine kinase [Altererythrobacter insulae]|nr:Histidine kinase [Altererythrobacter insulae]